MMRRRMMMRRPVANIARVAVGTAVVAGTAGAVHHHQQKKWANQQAQQQSQYDQAYQQGVIDAQAQQQILPLRRNMQPRSRQLLPRMIWPPSLSISASSTRRVC